MERERRKKEGDEMENRGRGGDRGLMLKEEEKEGKQWSEQGERAEDKKREDKR